MKTALFVILLIIPSLLFAWSENPAVGFPIDTAGQAYYGISTKAIRVNPDEWMILYGISQETWVFKAQKLDSKGNRLFMPDGVVLDSYLWEAALIYFWGSAVADDAGGVIAAWENNDPYSDCRTYAQRVSATGQLLWGASGVDLYPGLPAQFGSPANALVNDSEGHYYVSGFLTNHTKIYIQKFDVNGNLLWGSSGCLALQDTSVYMPYEAPWSWNPLVMQPDGNLWVVVRYNAYPYYQLRAQKIDSSGNILWEPGGRFLYQSPGNDLGFYGVVSDKRGGVWVCYDYQGPGHLRIRRFDSEGNPASGEIVLLQYQTFEGGDIHADTSGGCFLAWSDSRYWPIFEVFAQHLDSLGNSLLPYGGVHISPDHVKVGYRWSFSDSTETIVTDWYRYYTALGDYVQRMDAQGNLLWAPSGILTAKYPLLGEGIWPDQSGGGLQIYKYGDWCAQRFWQSGFIGGGPTVSLEATPAESLQYVPAQGGAVSFRLQGTSWESMPLIYDLWAQAKDSAGTIQQEWQMGPGPQLDTLYQVFNLDTSLQVNGSLPGGNYALTIIAGEYPDSIWGDDSQDSIAFYKEPGVYVPPVEKKYGRLQFQSESGPAGVTLRYELPQAARVRIVLFDLMGREVVTLEDSWRDAGAYRLNIASADLPSGIYLCRLEAGDMKISEKIVLTK